VKVGEEGWGRWCAFKTLVVKKRLSRARMGVPRGSKAQEEHIVQGTGEAREGTGISMRTGNKGGDLREEQDSASSQGSIKWKC
jgi:hypothetical protein